MNSSPVPRLRQEAIVRPFDDRGAQQRYIVAVDGCHFVVTATVAAVLEETRNLRIGEADLKSLGARVAHRLGRTIPLQQIDVLLRDRTPKSLFEATAPAPADSSPIVFRHLLLGSAQLEHVLALAGGLFTVRAALMVAAFMVSIESCVAAQSWRQDMLAFSTTHLVLGFALTLAGIFVHEVGHLAACRRFGAPHGGIGIGLYWCLPAFYAEVHGAWLLPRRQRAAVDAGGVYLQAVFVGLLGACQLAWPSPALLYAIAWSHFLMLHTLNPVMKFDGYWLLCDLAGVHNLHRTLRDIARRLVRCNWPNRGELALLAGFLSIALAYFTYLLQMLGRNIAVAAAGLESAVATADGSAPAALALLGKGALLAFISAVALGVALLLARAGRDLIVERISP